MQNLGLQKTLLIWDRDGEVPYGDDQVILWSSFSESRLSNTISLPKVVEDQSEDLRLRYLEWIYDIGETKIHDKRVIDHFSLMPGFSYWWMTLISHKPNYYESQYINDVIKCIAFENLYKSKFRQCTIKLVTSNKALRMIFLEYCKRSEIMFICEGISSEGILSKSALVLTTITKGLIYFIITTFRSFKNFAFKKSSWPENLTSTICCFDILVYLNDYSFKQGKFNSGYWGGLVSLLNELGLSTTWIHTYFKHSEIKTVKEAISCVGLLNESNSHNYHALIDSQISFRVVNKTIRYYLQIIHNYIALGQTKDLFNPKGSNFNYWQLFKKNWYDSFFGIHAVKCCISISVFNSILKKMPHQSMGIYIQENQPWEIAIINAWRNAGHGKLIGVPHTTIRFWDLRYFYASQTYSKISNSLPRPNCVAVNGPVAFDMYVKNGYPESELVEVEALRYLHLKNMPKQNSLIGSVTKTILVLGDNIVGSNEKLIEMIYHVNKHLNIFVNFVFKSHKARLFQFNDYHLENFKICEETILNQIYKSDIVITGNITSAAVDAYHYGLPVLTLLDPRTLNSSPLREIKGAYYFSTVSELIELINKNLHINQEVPKPYFHLNNDLILWKKLILKTISEETK
jgi:surface carbohydrate biosynthesis protein (TIGR04326 family)